jgi:hypothetical protein
VDPNMILPQTSVTPSCVLFSLAAAVSCRLSSTVPRGIVCHSVAEEIKRSPSESRSHRAGVLVTAVQRVRAMVFAGTRPAPSRCGLTNGSGGPLSGYSVTMIASESGG